MKSRIIIKVKDKYGKLKLKKIQPFRSFMRNMGRMFRYWLDGTTSTIVVNATAGEAALRRTDYFHLAMPQVMHAESGGELITYPRGVSVCSGSMAAITYDTGYMPTAVRTGTATGRLQYFAPKHQLKKKRNSEEQYVEVSRPMVNITVDESDVTITGCGLCAQMLYSTAYDNNIASFALDAFDEAITLEYLDVIEIIYQLYCVNSTTFGFTNEFMKHLRGLFCNTISRSYYNGTSPYPYPLTSIVYENTEGGTWTYSSSASPGTRQYMRVNAGVGDDTYGIVIGSGWAGLDPDMKALDVQIPHGTNADELYYETGIDVAGETIIDGHIIRLYFQRKFINETISPITVREYAWYGYGGGANKRLMFARGKLPNPLEILPGYSIFIKITIDMDFTTGEILEGGTSV